MKIRWFGQSCFLLTSNAGTRVLMDPFGKGIGYAVPRVEAEIVTISHHHFDHDYTGAVIGDFTCVDRAGSFREGEVEILGIPTFHDKVQGSRRGPNVVYRVTMDGINICHCGDLGHSLSQEQVDALGKVDVLLVPVGGRVVLDGAEAAGLRRALSPAITIPMHYRTKAMGLAGLLFARIELFLSVVGENPSTVRELELEPSSLAREKSIVVMDYE
jgi:L-ascorbate metabolism protein UlaG (beta-lactamase superfamily)